MSFSMSMSCCQIGRLDDAGHSESHAAFRDRSVGTRHAASSVGRSRQPVVAARGERAHSTGFQFYSDD